MATQAYYILDELLVGGEIQETSKKNIIRATAAQDMLQEVCTCTIYIPSICSNYRCTHNFAWSAGYKCYVVVWKFVPSKLELFSPSQETENPKSSQTVLEEMGLA